MAWEITVSDLVTCLVIVLPLGFLWTYTASSSSKPLGRGTGSPGQSTGLVRHDPLGLISLFNWRSKLRGRLSRVPDEQLGIKVLYPPTERERNSAKVDIVAVHGLAAIPDSTWVAHTGGNESVAGGNARTRRVNWLQDADMLPDLVKEARILRFGYDSLWIGEDPVRTSITLIANELKDKLQETREVPLILRYKTTTF